MKDENIIFEDKVEEVTIMNIRSLIYFGKLDVNPQYCLACGCVKRMILDFATNALTLKHIAETCNVSDHTVQRVIDGASKELKTSIFDALP